MCNLVHRAPRIVSLVVSFFHGHFGSRLKCGGFSYFDLQLLFVGCALVFCGCGVLCAVCLFSLCFMVVKSRFFFEDRAHTPNFSVTDCDMNIERKLSSSTTRCTFTSRRKCGVCFSNSHECAIILRGLSLEFEVCNMNVRSRFRLHPRVAKSKASMLIKFTIDSARNCGGG